VEEINEVSTDYLMACALHPTTWSSWVPAEILEACLAAIPATVAFSISCLPDGLWIVADKEYNLLLSTERVQIIRSEPPAPVAANNSTFFSALAEAITGPKKEPPKDPPPKRVA
jgi:hypothetical protein